MRPRVIGRSLSTTVAAVVLVGVASITLLAPWIAPYEPNAQDLGSALMPPFSPGHVLGTDEMGRDVLSRLLFGGRPILLIALGSTAIALVAGTFAGLFAGYVGGFLGAVTMRLADLQLSFPPIALAVLLAAILSPGVKSALISIALVTWPQVARIVRADTLRVSTSDYVSLARVAGLSRREILGRHVAPNVATVIIVIGTINLGVAVIFSAAMSFLGVGVQAPRADWGNMLAAGTQYLDFWWLVVMPGLVITLVVLCVSITGDALRDRLDPRSATGGSRRPAMQVGV